MSAEQIAAALAERDELLAKIERLTDRWDALADEQVREGDVAESEVTRRFSNGLRAAIRRDLKDGAQ